MWTLLTESKGFLRIVIILILVLSFHILVLFTRLCGKRVISNRYALAFSMARTLFGFLLSTIIFAMYFVALGLIFKEFGISLTAYFASASVIALAVGFGSQGFVQDVVTGLTIVLSKLFYLEDMVEIAGQTGTVKAFGVRFTVMVNYMGAEIYIPNRTITNVVNYPKGYIHAIVEIQLPLDNELAKAIEDCVEKIMQDNYERFPGIHIKAPSVIGKYRTASNKEYLKIKFRIWPGQGTVLENNFRRELIESLKKIDPKFSDYMLVLNYEVESKKTSL